MIRRVMIVLTLCAAAGGAIRAEPPTLVEVLGRYYEAIGGLEAWRNVETLRLTGRLSLPGGAEGPFSLTFARPLKSRLEYTVDGATAVQGLDGETAWLVMPMPDIDGPIPLTAEQTELMKEQADFEGPLVGWESKGHRVELGAVEDKGAFRLLVTLASGAAREYVLDRETFLPKVLRMTASFQDEKFGIETVFDDYRAVGDVIIAHSIASSPGDGSESQVMLIESAEANVAVQDELFTRPTPPPAAAGEQP